MKKSIMFLILLLLQISFLDALSLGDMLIDIRDDNDQMVKKLHLKKFTILRLKK